MDTNKQITAFWQQGLNQPIISEGSSLRQVAFDYSKINKSEISKSEDDFARTLREMTFLDSNWNDIMMSPLRGLLHYVNSEMIDYLPIRSREFISENFHFSKTVESKLISTALLVSNTQDIAVQWLWDENQNSYIIHAPKYLNNPIHIEIYKTRGSIEFIGGVAPDSLPADLEELNTIYDIFHLKSLEFD